MRKSQSGFSLLEGMVVISIAAVMLLMVAPMFLRAVSEHHLTTYTNDLIASLQSARHTAIKTNMAVSLCSSDNGLRCTDTPWARGYILFSDGGDPGVMDGPDRPLKAVNGRDTRLRVTLNGANYVRFLGNGGLVAGLSGNSEPKAAGTTLLSRMLDALSPVATAHAMGTIEPMPAAQEPVAFLVCNGSKGLAVRLTTVGRVESTSVSCH